MFAISAMFAFYNARKNVSGKEKLQERLGTIPATLLDGLLSKFTDSARGSTKYVASIVHDCKYLLRSDAQNTGYTGNGDKFINVHVRSVPPGG